MFEKLKEKNKLKFSEIKNYHNLLRDFDTLNKYIRLSSKCLTRIEFILNSDLEDDVILDNIKIIYSDFKNDYNTDDIVESFKVKNNFDRGDL